MSTTVGCKKRNRGPMASSVITAFHGKHFFPATRDDPLRDKFDPHQTRAHPNWHDSRPNRKSSLSYRARLGGREFISDYPWNVLARSFSGCPTPGNSLPRLLRQSHCYALRMMRFIEVEAVIEFKYMSAIWHGSSHGQKHRHGMRWTKINLHRAVNELCP